MLRGASPYFRKRAAWWSIWGGSDGCVWIKITKDGKSKWRLQTRVVERVR